MYYPKGRISNLSYVLGYPFLSDCGIEQTDDQFQRMMNRFSIYGDENVVEKYSIKRHNFIPKSKPIEQSKTKHDGKESVYTSYILMKANIGLAYS